MKIKWYYQNLGSSGQRNSPKGCGAHAFHVGTSSLNSWHWTVPQTLLEKYPGTEMLVATGYYWA